MSKKNIRTLALVCALGLMVTGCGGGDDSGATGSPSPTVEATDTAAPAETPTEEVSPDASPADESTPEASPTDDAGSSDAGSSADDASTLATFVALTQTLIPQMKQELGDEFSDVAVKGVEPGTIEFVFTLATKVNPDDVKEDMDAAIPKHAEDAEQFFTSMADMGIQDPQVTYTFLNPDETTVWTHTFSK
ncbi:MAG: hypothetical protein LBH13_10585 [Cellulomonadaceae bacterium]|nr:hypothetical protein [Cellulomonadaceae bacterium]